MSNQPLSRSQANDALATQKKPLGWVKIIGGGLLLIVALILALKLAGFLIKWGVLLLLLYGGYRLFRYFLSNTSSDEKETVLQIDEAPEEHILGQLETERELDELKSRMKSAPPR